MANQEKGKHINPTKVVTGEARLSYANLWEPKSINGGTPKYSVSIIIPKSDARTVAKVRAAIEAAYREGETKLKGNGKTVPTFASIKTPLRDGDTERPDDEALVGSFFMQRNRDRAGHRRQVVRADLRTFPDLQWRIRPSQRELLRVQLEREQGCRLRIEQHSEAPRRRTARREVQS